MSGAGACPTCGAGNPADARWCGRCGGALDAGQLAGAVDVGGAGHSRDRRTTPATAPAWRSRRVLAAAGVGLVVGVAALLNLLGVDDGEQVDEPGTVELPAAGNVPGDTGATRPAGGPLPACPDGATQSPPLPQSACRRWSVTLPGDMAAPRAVALGEAAVAVARPDGRLQLRDRVTGQVRWVRQLGGRPAPVALTGRHVHTIVQDRDLVALDATSGRTVWRTQVGADLAPFPGSDEVIRDVLSTGTHVFAVAGGQLVALGADTGDVLWRWTRQHVLSAGLGPDGQPYVVAVNGPVGLAAADGTIRWRVELVTFNTRPHRLIGGLIVIGDDLSQVTAIDPASGQVRWQHDVGAPALVRALFPIPDGVLVDVFRGGFQTFALSDGTPRADVDGEFEITDVVRGLAVGRDKTSSDYRGVGVRVVEDGVRLWRASVPGLLNDLRVVDGEVRATSSDALLGLDATTGTQLWRHRFGGTVELLDAETPVLVTSGDQLVAVVPPDRPSR